MEGSERLQTRAFTDYIARPHHDVGHVYNSIHHNVQPYSTNGTLSYVSNNSYMQHCTIPATYSPFSAAFTPTSGPTQGAILFSYSGGSPYPGAGSMHYSVQPPPRSATLPSQPRVFARGYSSSAVGAHHCAGSMFTRPPFDYSLLHETEEQDSVNRDSGQSEPIEPALEGYPDVNEFDDLMKHYVAQLSPKKQDKALINAARALNIRFVLSNKKTTAVESAQFRFWAKKMFQLQPTAGSVPVEKRKICHENKPIAVREKLFKILTRAHQKCQHGGRDKTSAQVRKVYSWVPKELISRFVKLCPTCRERRGAVCAVDDNSVPPTKTPTTMTATATTITSPTDLLRSAPKSIRSPLKRRRSPSFSEGRNINVSNVPVQLANSSSAFQNQSRWMMPDVSRATYEEQYTLADPYSFTGLDSTMKVSSESMNIKQDTSQDAKRIARRPSHRQPELHSAYD